MARGRHEVATPHRAHTRAARKGRKPHARRAKNLALKKISVAAVPWRNRRKKCKPRLARSVPPRPRPCKCWYSNSCCQSREVATAVSSLESRLPDAWHVAANGEWACAWPGCSFRVLVHCMHLLGTAEVRNHDLFFKFGRFNRDGLYWRMSRRADAFERLYEDANCRGLAFNKEGLQWIRDDGILSVEQFFELEARFFGLACTHYGKHCDDAGDSDVGSLVHAAEHCLDSVISRY